MKKVFPFLFLFPIAILLFSFNAFSQGVAINTDGAAAQIIKKDTVARNTKQILDTIGTSLKTPEEIQR